MLNSLFYILKLYLKYCSVPRFSFWIATPEKNKTKHDNKSHNQQTNKKNLKQRCAKILLDYTEYVYFQVLTALLLRYVDTFITYNQRESQLLQNKTN